MNKNLILQSQAEIRQNRDSKTMAQCEKAKQLERAGDYPAARKALAGVWSVIGERPDLSGLAPDTQGQVLLRAGALSGWLGSTHQLKGSQEFAKDLIGESIRIFESLENKQNLVAEAQIDLAICYWREGAFDEARLLFREARSHSTTAENQLRAIVNSTIAEISSGHPDAALALLAEGAPLLEAVPIDHLHGRFYMQRGLAYKKLGGAENFDRALLDYAAAVYHLEKAGHTRYVARVENNIGCILLMLKRYNEAIQHLDRARSIFVTLKDSASVAQVNESRARVYLSQGRNAAAERVAFAAVTTLQHGGEQSLLAEALITHGLTLARLGKSGPALRSFRQAVSVGDTSGDLRSSASALLMMIEELHGSIDNSEVVQAFLEADRKLASTLDSETAERFRSCSRIVANLALNASTAFEEHLIGGTMDEELRHFEAQLIKRALDQENGSITRAARSLGISHQGLTYLIENRHVGLSSARNPPRRRNKPIMKH